MDEEVRRKLQAVMQRKRKHEHEVAAAKQAEQVERDRRERQKVETEQFWPTAVQHIRSAVDVVNAEIDDDMEFKLGELLKRVSHEFGSIPISLIGPDEAERTIHLNVSEFGYVRAVFNIPHSGKSPELFSLIDADVNFYAELLTDFLSQVVDYIGSK